MFQVSRKITAASLCILLAACGGGGGNDDNPSGNAPNTGTGTPGGNSGQDGGGSPLTPGGTDPSTPSFAVDASARFNTPDDIAIDNAGNLYVMDRANQRIRKIAVNGDVTSIPGTHRPGQLIADAAGNLFVLSHNPVEDEESRTSWEVHKITPDGTRTLTFRSQIQPGSYDPRNIAIDAQGRLFILTQYRNVLEILRIELDGSVKRVYHSNAVGIAMDSDNEGDIALVTAHPFGLEEYLYAYIPTSAQAAEPAEFDTPGVVISELESRLIGDMVLAQNGDAYFADTAGTEIAVTAIRIRKRAQDGTVTTVYEGFPDGSTASRPKTESYQGQLGMTRAANGDFYLADPYVHAVFRISASGQVSLAAGKPGEAGNSD